MTSDDTLTSVIREAVRGLLHDAHAELRRAADGAEAASLAWRPDAPDPNSISGLVFHVAEAERWLLSNALHRPHERDREAQFTREPSEPAELAAALDEADRFADALLDQVTAGHLLAEVTRGAATRTGAAWLLRAVGHAREHAGQALLTRDLAERSRLPGGRVGDDAGA